MKKQIQYFLVTLLFSHFACFASDSNRTYPRSILKTSALYKEQRLLKRQASYLKKFFKQEETKKSIEKARQILRGNAALYCVCAVYARRQSQNSQFNQPVQKRTNKVMSQSARMFFNLFKSNTQR